MKLITFIAAFILIPIFSFAQANKVEDLDTTYLNWYNQDYEATGVLGASVDYAYDYLEKEQLVSTTVVVAVIDGGVDIDHEDLKERIWVNEDEIADNGIDDDENGYIDDMHGWNFIGNADGENVKYENLEYTRLVRENDANNPLLPRAQEMYDNELEKRRKERESLDGFIQVVEKTFWIIKTKTGVEIKTAEDLKRVQSEDPQVLAAKKFLQGRFDAGFTMELLDQLVEQNRDYLDYHLNQNFRPREIVGDNPNDWKDRGYGNPDVKGPRADHGTSVAGVIAAVRDNEIGINGIASDVEIMVVRSTPKGDERDKDVALAIYYAVDNGADIINMSFGKEFSPQKQFVDEAVRYAEQKGVLLIHTAGNNGLNIDQEPRYPTDEFLEGGYASNWLNVGASTLELNKELVAQFSNYGAEDVDIFAPGVNILSTDTLNTYSLHDGTSLAAPVVSGVAALVLSYYPDLQPLELIDILLSSSFQFKKPKKVYLPNLEAEKPSKVKFDELSTSGGVVNAYLALKEAQKRNMEASLKGG
ncbi:S8 family peptidase [Reichenbachiella ulvae]|uniref:S8 family peptidase n=1 Tax=Reichenbachiella ulvae TaxID=2980104 RepID=A0ABT3CU61_9BACT|nr:S8 family peptidase [Reichenbachiella ulvae]MCV9387094.1 S8 family peptidase [Reichenbachiella ulvae]